MRNFLECWNVQSWQELSGILGNSTKTFQLALYSYLVSLYPSEEFLETNFFGNSRVLRSGQRVQASTVLESIEGRLFMVLFLGLKKYDVGK